MPLVILTEPRSEPIKLSDARRWLGMTDDNDTDQDPELELLIQAMRERAESYTGRRFVDRDLELDLDCWPSRSIELPVAPVVAINYVRYIDVDGVLQTLYDATVSPTVGADLVAIDIKSQPARIQPAYSQAWPSLRGGDYNAVQVGFTAGYGTGGSPEDLSPIPAAVKLWMRARLATLYENRETIIVGTIVNELPRADCDAMLDPLILGRRVA